MNLTGMTGFGAHPSPVDEGANPFSRPVFLDWVKSGK